MKYLTLEDILDAYDPQRKVEWLKEALLNAAAVGVEGLRDELVYYFTEHAHEQRKIKGVPMLFEGIADIVRNEFKTQDIVEEI